MKAVIDTNVLVYDTIENSPFHEQASRLIDKLELPMVNSISIIELGFVLPRYGVDSHDVKRKLDELLQRDLFSVSWLSNKMLAGASEFVVKNNLSFRDFNDWIIAFDAYSRKIPIATFDRNLEKQCKKSGIEILEGF